MESQDISQIKQLQQGSHYIVPESDYGKAEVWRINDVYLLFQIPIYGGEPVFEKAYPTPHFDQLISAIDSWT